MKSYVHSYVFAQIELLRCINTSISTLRLKQLFESYVDLWMTLKPVFLHSRLSKQDKSFIPLLRYHISKENNIDDFPVKTS